MMPVESPPPLLTRRHLLLMALLFFLLAGVYWFTYTGKIISVDEVWMFDGVESLVRRGNILINLASNFHPFRYFPIESQPHTTVVITEPMQILAAAPLFALADGLESIGLLHAVWLLNVLVCAAGGPALFLYARSLGYGERTAIAGALVYGLGTIAWPYSKAFFREPLAMLLLFTAALCLNAWRARWGTLRGWWWLAGFAAAFFMALLTKEVALFTGPALLVLAVPGFTVRLTRRRLALILGAVAGAALLAVALLALLLEILPVARTYNPLTYLDTLGEGWPFISYAIASYLFSPGRSLFAFSPVLLLALPGLWLLLRARRWRELAAPLLAVSAFVLGYAVIRNAEWFGGKAWGPRFLVPVTLFAMLLVLPALERVLHPKTPRWLRWGAAAVIILSIAVQVTGVLVHPTAYFTELEQRGVVAWEGGTWDLAQIPLAVNWQLLNRAPLDFAWLRAEDAGAWLPLSALLVIAAAGGLLYVLRRGDFVGGRRGLLAGIALAALLAGSFYAGLRSIKNDPDYLGGFTPLHDLMTTLDAQARPGDMLLLPNPTYQPYFYNNYQNSEVLLLTLPTQIGERPSPEQPPGLESANPDLLLAPRYSIFMTNIPEYTDRVWLLNNTGPFSTYAVRPVEWFMARHYFPVAEYRAGEGEVARLLLFEVNSDAPPDQAMAWPSQRVEAQYDESIRLVGFDVPPPRVRVGPFAGREGPANVYRPGEVVPLSLLWQALETPSLDYNVSARVVRADGAVVVQHDSAPQGGFRPMNAWRAGEYVRDNHGLLLPEDLAAGTYELWVQVYSWQSGEALPASGADSGEDGISARLMTIQVEE